MKIKPYHIKKNGYNQIGLMLFFFKTETVWFVELSKSQCPTDKRPHIGVSCGRDLPDSNFLNYKVIFYPALAICKLSGSKPRKKTMIYKSKKFDVNNA